MKAVKDLFVENKNKVYLDSVDFTNEDTGLDQFILPDVTEFDKEIDLIKYAIRKVPYNANVAYAHFHKYNKEDRVEVTAWLLQKLPDGNVEMFSIR